MGRSGLASRRRRSRPGVLRRRRRMTNPGSLHGSLHGALQGVLLEALLEPLRGVRRLLRPWPWRSPCYACAAPAWRPRSRISRRRETAGPLRPRLWPGGRGSDGLGREPSRQGRESALACHASLRGGATPDTRNPPWRGRVTCQAGRPGKSDVSDPTLPRKPGSRQAGDDLLRR